MQKKTMKKIGTLGLVSIMATASMTPYLQHNVEAARNHEGVCEIETKSGEFSFNANSTTVRTQKPLDLLLIMDGSGSINDDKAKKMFQIYASLLKTLPSDTKVSIAVYGTNRANSYVSEGLGYDAGPMTPTEALGFIQPLADNFAPIPDDLVRAIKASGKGNGGNQRPYETWFASNLRPDAVHSILQVTDEWVDYEEIDYSFAEWAKKNAKTFMSVIMYPNENTTSYRQMRNAGHPNIYVTGSKDIDTVTREVNEQFKSTATETVSKPKTIINVTPEQGLTLKEVKLVSPDGKEESLAITDNKVNVEKDLPQDGKWTVKVKAEGLVHETKKVTATANIGDREVGKTEIVFEGCQNLVRGADEEKNNVNLPFDTTYEDTDELPSGETRVKREGVVGIKEIKKVWSTLNGQRQGNPRVTESVVKPKVDKIILRGTQQKKTVYYRIVEPSGKVLKDNTKVTDGYKGTKYSVTKPTMSGHEIELKAGMQENGTLQGRDVIVDYVAYKLGQRVKAKYVDETGAELKSEVIVKNAGLRNGAQYSIAPEPVLEKDSLKFVYKELKQGSAPASGVVSDNEQVVTFVYKKAEGKAVRAEFVKKDTAMKLIDDLIIKPAGTQVGTPWTSAHENELVKDNLAYVIDSQIPVEQGRVTETEQILKYNYVPKLGKGVKVKYMHEDKEVKDALELVKDGVQVGTDWNSERINEIEKDELAYSLDTENLPTEAGRVTTEGQEVVYKYVPKLGKGVKVKYLAGDKEIKEELELVKDGIQVGTKWESERVGEIEKDGLVYVLDESTLPTESGRITTEGQEVVYKYVPKLGKGVKVKYMVGDKTIKDELELVKDGIQVGTKWSSERVHEIEKDGLVYVLDEKSLPTEDGRITTESQEVVYKYVPKLGKGVKVKYMYEDKEIKDSIELVKDDAQVGTKWHSSSINEIEKDGLVYVLDTKNLPTESGRVTTKPQEVVYRYVPKIGKSVKVKYLAGDKEIKGIETVSEGKQVGSKYEKEVAREITVNDTLYRFVGLKKLEEDKSSEKSQSTEKQDKSAKSQISEESRGKSDKKSDKTSDKKEESQSSKDSKQIDASKSESDANVIEIDSKSSIQGAKFNGLVNNHEQMYVAQYEMVKSRTVAVTFVDENGKELQNKIDLVKEDQKVGTDYQYKPKDIEKDGVKYTVDKITLADKQVNSIAGKSTEKPILYTVHYRKVPEKKGILPRTGLEGSNAVMVAVLALLSAISFRRFKKR